MNTRGFKKVSTYPQEKLNIPKRATRHSAGYDFEAAQDIVLPSIWNTLFKHNHHASSKGITPVLVPTGIKAYMQEDEYLQLTNRSSNPLKHFLVLPNGVGIVDADYYNNPGNEGEIFFQLLNFGLRGAVSPAQGAAAPKATHLLSATTSTCSINFCSAPGQQS